MPQRQACLKHYFPRPGATAIDVDAAIQPGLAYGVEHANLLSADGEQLYRPDTTFAPASSLMQSYITPPFLRMPDMVNATVLVPL